MNITTFSFEQESYNTNEFRTFARIFKEEFKKEIAQVGGVLSKFNVGHFYLSGFFTIGTKFYYFSWHNDNTDLLYRTAKNDEDYFGGQNMYVRIETGMAKKMRL
ncbi:MAG: hypothetical protein KA163_05005 [Bacteroidia bacterium]|nr:hypothetical protein [Bacteroidia bacterium]